MSDQYSIRRQRLERSDPRLGRHVHHDSRSLSYAYPATTLHSARHTSFAPVFDQGQVGSCTGNAAVKCLTYEPFSDFARSLLSSTSASADEQVALAVYSEAEVIDGDGPYPPHDNGSSGLSVAKALKQRGWISGYQHAFSLDAALAALVSQPVIAGTNWTESMFNPASDGRIVPSGTSQGGHEYVLDEIDVERRRVWIQNSWGTSWGVEGHAYMSWDDFGSLLSERGDVTVFTPADLPAPEPNPVPQPGPDLTPVGMFRSASQEWLSHPKSSAVNVQFKGALQEYLRTL